MSSRGKWLVMCKAERALSMRDVLEKIDVPDEASARLVGEVLVLTVDGTDAEVQVALTTDPVVLEEAAEFAEEYGAGRADRALIATYDARYEISWNLADSMEVFETYYTIAFELVDLTGGITLDLQEKKFVEA
jgi:hypothetical protein